MADANQQDKSLEMSDEDFLNQPVPEPVAPTDDGPDVDTGDAGAPDATQEQENVLDQEDTPEEPDDDADQPDKEETNDEGAKEGEGATAGSKPKPDVGDKTPAKKQEGDPSKSDPGKTPGTVEGEGGPGPADKTATNEPVDYEKAYKELMAPFKANGREIQARSIDEVRTLMQMGANYNKKMSAVKPHLKLMKMLENNGLLDEAKLSFLIDLDKKNPEAISKLVTEAGVDPMDIDADKAKGYKSGTYSVSDKEVELDSVLNELETTPTYQRTLSIVGKEWDQTSRDAVAATPQVLKLINTHVERGIYDIISTEMERERALGRLNGLSDFEAYRQVGDAINARGGFDHLVSTETKGQQTPAKAAVVTPAPKKVDDDKLKDKRRAASTTRPAASGKATNDFNPLAMSDAEYAKLGDKAHLM